jgi:putative tryptophan/tyrosine transport system substrate-binding protein
MRGKFLGLLLTTFLLVTAIGEAQQPKKVPRIGFLTASPSVFPGRIEAFRQGLRELGYVEEKNIVVASLRILFTASFGEAQQAGRNVTIGFLGNSSPSIESSLVEAFREGLRQLGYVEGQNLVIRYQWAEGQQERQAVLARELVRLKPDIIVTGGTPGTFAAKQATQSIPIVTAIVGDPVASGLVSSLAKPGGNVTGLATLNEELEGKRLEIFKEVVPQLSQVAVLLNPANPFTTIAWKGTQSAAKALGVKLQPVEVRDPHDLDPALATIKAARPQGLILVPDRLLTMHRAAIVEFMNKNRLPGIFPWPEFPQAGGLMSYGADTTDMYRRAATYVDKILKGRKPADLPVEQPMKFEFVINLITANQIGLTIPPNVLARADKVIR